MSALCVLPRATALLPARLDADLRNGPSSSGIPDCELIHEYIAVVGPTTEAPLEFHAGAMLTALSVAIGRTVWMPRPDKTYLNLYTVLAGKTGDARKSTAIRAAVEFLKAVSTMTSRRARIMRGIASPEGLVSEMRGLDGMPAWATLDIEDEVASVFAKGRKQRNLIPRLAEVYHLPERLEVNTRQNALCAERPFLSLLGGTTMEWFAASLTTDDVHGGLFNRFAVFCGEPTSPKPVPPPVDAQAFAKLAVHMAERIEKAKGEYRFTCDAEEAFRPFYCEHRNRTLPALEMAATARVDDLACRFALLFAVFDGHDRIETTDIRRGMGLAGYCAMNSMAVLPLIGTSHLRHLEIRLLDLLRRGPMTQRDAMQRLHLSSPELVPLVAAMERTGVIRMYEERTTAGRSRKMIAFIPVAPPYAC